MVYSCLCRSAFLSPFGPPLLPAVSPIPAVPSRLSPCRRLQNGTRWWPGQAAAVTGRGQPAAGASCEPTLSFRMTHWSLPVIPLFLTADREQPKSYTGLDQGKRFKYIFFCTCYNHPEDARMCMMCMGTKWKSGNDSVGVCTPGIAYHQCV